MKEFLIVISMAGIVACPVAYYIMNNWLRGYAYRINVSAQPFIFAVVCLGLVTMILICLQTIKTALTNPVESLRTE